MNSISRRLLPVDGAHAASSEEMATTMSRAESVACKGLQQCIETVIAEVCDLEYLFFCIGLISAICGTLVLPRQSNSLVTFTSHLMFSNSFICPLKPNILFDIMFPFDCFQVERLLSTEQKATDYRSPDDGIIPDHRPTSACAW